MNGVIPKNIYRTIEYRLHTYNQMKERIEDWQASVYTTQNTQESIGGKGHVSDPTARIVINLLNPPKNIKEDMKWVEIIEQTIEYSRKTGTHGIFEVWYGCERVSPLSAANKINVDERTFYRWRENAVMYTVIRAVKNNLVAL